MRPGLEVERDEGEWVAGAGQRGLVLVLETHGQDLHQINGKGRQQLYSIAIGHTATMLLCNLYGRATPTLTKRQPPEPTTIVGPP